MTRPTDPTALTRLSACSSLWTCRRRYAAHWGGCALAWGSSPTRLRWVRGVGLHVTLKFLGDVDADDKARLIECFGRPARVRTVRAAVRGAGCVRPNSQGPRTLGGIEGNVVALNKLQKDVEAAAASAGCELETRPFRPHVSLARARGSGSGAKLAPALDALLSDSRRRMFGEWTVGQVVLYSSRLTREAPCTPLFMPTS
ncbi:MAG: RNA 2',3'-cyclic phosphodiesterase [Chloroflexia bacterium]